MPVLCLCLCVCIDIVAKHVFGRIISMQRSRGFANVHGKGMSREALQRTVDRPCTIIFCRCNKPYCNLLDAHGRHTCGGEAYDADVAKSNGSRVINLSILDFVLVVASMVTDTELFNNVTAKVFTGTHTHVSSTFVYFFFFR